MGRLRLAADQVAYLFGVRLTKRLRGKWHSVLEKLDPGPHVMRIYCQNLVGRMDEKFSTFLRVEVCVNRMKDLGLNQGLKNLEALRQKLIGITDRFAGFEAQSRNGHVEFPLLQKIALPVMSGQTKIAGSKIHDTRMMRLMEVLLHGGTQLNGWRSPDIHPAILSTFGLAAGSYTLTQLRYDLRQMKAHGLLERIGRSYRYRLSDKGTKAALLFILFHKRVCGPLANSLFHHRPKCYCFRPFSRFVGVIKHTRARVEPIAANRCRHLLSAERKRRVPLPLFVTQRQHRIEPRRPASRPVAGGQTGPCDRRDHSGQRHRVVGRDAEELAGEDARRYERDEHADDDACGYQPQAHPQNHPEHVGTCRAQCHPDTDLVRLARDRIRDDAVHANGNEQKPHARKNS